MARDIDLVRVVATIRAQPTDRRSGSRVATHSCKLAYEILRKLCEFRLGLKNGFDAAMRGGKAHETGLDLGMKMIGALGPFALLAGQILGLKRMQAPYPSLFHLYTA